MNGDFALPGMQEISEAGEVRNVFVTTTRGEWVPTRKSREGILRYGFCECPVGAEDLLLAKLCRTLDGVAARVSSVKEAAAHLERGGLQATSLVLPEALVERVCGENAVQGKVEGLNILVAAIPDGLALVTAHPAFVGSATRIGDHFGVMILNADRTLVLVDGLAG